MSESMQLSGTTEQWKTMWRHVLAALLLLLLFAFLAKVLRGACPIPTTREGALTALVNIREWAKWMSGIQTAAIASLVYLVFEKDSVARRQHPTVGLFPALVAFVFLGAGLFSSAWVLSSLSSHAIRLHGIPASELSTQFDIYETRAFGWTFEWITLGYLLSVTHWLWGVGLLALGGTVVSLLVSRQK